MFYHNMPAELPLEIWHQILRPEDDMRKCTSHESELGYDDDTTTNQAEKPVNCFCRNSSSYRSLRLVSRVFNTVIETQAFKFLNICFEDHPACESLVYLTNHPRLLSCVSEINMTMRSATGEDPDVEYRQYFRTEYDGTHANASIMQTSEIVQLTRQIERLLPSILQACLKVNTISFDMGCSFKTEVCAGVGRNVASCRQWSRAGTILVKSILDLCHYKFDQAKNDIVPMKALLFENISVDCAHVEDEDLYNACLGVSHLESLVCHCIKANTYEQNDMRLEKLIGSLFRAAHSTKSFLLKCTSPISLRMHLEDVLFGPFVRQNDAVLLPWQQLTSVTLAGLFTLPSTITSFLTSHAKTLTEVHLENIYLSVHDLGIGDPWLRVLQTFSIARSKVERPNICVFVNNLTFNGGPQYSKDEVLWEYINSIMHKNDEQSGTGELETHRI